MRRAPRPVRGAPDVSTSTAETPNVAASIPMAQPAPTATMTTPEIAAPARPAEFCESWISALADCNSDGFTICGTRPRDAGINKAFAAPLTAESATSGAVGGVPEINSAATPACAASASRSEPTMIR